MPALRKFLVLLAILFIPFLVHADWQQPSQNIGVPVAGGSADLAIAIDPTGDAVGITSKGGVIDAATRPFNGDWTVPVNVSFGNDVEIAVDQNGNAVAIWQIPGFIQTSNFDGVSWSGATNIDTGTVSLPKLAMSPSGRVLATWVKDNGGPSWVVRYATASAYNGALVASTLSNSNPTGIQSLDVSVSDNGNGLVGWIESPSFVRVRRISSTGTLSSIDTISTGLSIVNDVSVALANTNGVAVWTNTTTTAIDAAPFCAGSWFLSSPIPGTVTASTPDVAIDDAGNAVAVWVQANDIRGAYLSVCSGVWQNTSPLNNSAFNASDPKVVMDGVGNAVAIWNQLTAAAAGVVQGATLPFETLTWGQITNLSDSIATATIQANTTRLTINEAGNVLAGWAQDDTVGPITTTQTSANSIPSTDTSTVLVTNPVPPNPATVLADGSDSATIVVTVLDGNGEAIPGNTIVLTQNGAATIAPAASGITNANGQITYTVTNMTPQIVTFTATDQQTSIVIGTVDVTFITAADAALSTISASPPQVPATGVDFSTVTVTLRDSGGNLLSGHTIQLDGVPNNSVISPATAVTVNGIAQFQVRSVNIGPVDYTATDITAPNSPIVIDDTATVTFIAPVTSPANSTVVAVPTSVQADGIAESIITVTLRNANNNPVPGHLVQLTQNVGGNSTILALPPLMGFTNAGGEATFSVKDLVVENVTYTATDLTNGPIVVTQKAVVNFTALVPDPVLSTITASPTAVQADGIAFSTVTVTLRNLNNVPISGRQVMLQQGAGSSSIVPLVGITNSNGQVFFTVKDLVSELVTYTAKDLTSGIVIVGVPPAQVNFQPRVTDAVVSTVNANPTSVFADGVSFSTITVRLKNINGAPVVGHNVSLIANGGSSIITPPSPSGPSDASGVVIFTVTDTAVESVTYTATDLTNSVVINQTATVNFTPPPPLPPSNFEGIRVVNKFATQREFTDILTWTPSLGTNVVSYRIYVNGVLERTIPALGPFRAEFKGRCDNLTYVYRLVAVSDQGVESAPLFVTLPKL